MKFDKRLAVELRAVRGLFMLAVGLGVLNGVLIVGQAYTLSHIVSGVFRDRQTLYDVQGLLLVLILLAVLRAGAIWGADIFAKEAASRLKHDLRNRLFKHLLTAGPTIIGREKSGELLNTLTNGVESLDAYISKYLPQTITAVIIPLVVLLIILPIDWLSGLVLLLTAPLLPFFMSLIGKWAGTLNERQWRSLSMLSGHFLDVLQGLTTLKVFNRSQAQIKTIERISEAFRQTSMSVLRVAFLSAFALEMLTTLSVAIIAVEIGLRVLYGGLPFEEAFFILVLAPEFYQPLRNMGAAFHAGLSGVEAAERIYTLLETPPAIQISPTEPIPPPQFPETITFAEVFYRYANREQDALNGVSFTFASGEKIAVVGASGAGKSTLAYLLLRFIDPTQGRILVNGQPLTAIDAAMWRTKISWVSQTPYLFNTTISENIRLARPEASLDEILYAARQARVDEFALTLPNQWDTVIGERGIRLSGGQAQRVALSRAFLKDAPLLIWDEATTHLDPVNTEIIQSSMAKLMRGRSVLMIAHDANNLRSADRVIQLVNGRVTESGLYES